MIIISGIFDLYIGTKSSVQSEKSWLIISGILEILSGTLIFIFPSIINSVLPYILGFWLMFRGYVGIGIATDMINLGVKGAGWILLLAILLVICSFLTLANPLIGLGSIVLWVGISFLITGIEVIVFSFQLSKLKNNYKKIEK